MTQYFRSNNRPAPTRPARGTGRLLGLVGKAMGLDRAGRDQAMEALAGAATLERLEDRAMLEGSFATAIAINLANLEQQGSAAGVINPSQSATDNDYYTFTAATTDFVTVLADTANESPASSLNTRVTVYGSANLADVIATGSTNGTLSTGQQRDGWVGFVAQAGRQYYIVVSSDYAGPGPNLTTGNAYTVRVDAKTDKFEIGTDTGIGRESGSPPPGVPLPPLRPVQGALNLRQQDQVYQYTTPDSAPFTSLVTVNAQFTNYAPTTLPNSTIPDRLDTRVEVYDSNGTLLAFDSDAGRLNDAFATFKATRGVTYYIRVRSDEVRPRNANDPAFDVTLATGPFFLVLDGRATDLTIDPVTRRAPTVNGAFTSFGDPTTPPTPVIANPTFQTDVYSFIAQGDGLAFIVAQPTGLAPVNDPALRLLDENGVQLAYNDNFAGTSPQLTVSLAGGRRYYVIVDGFEISSLVQYTLNIEAQNTFVNSGGNVVDDHIDTPAIPANATPEQIEAARAQFQQATGLNFGPAFLTLDADNNPLRDRGYRTTATGTGRLWTAGDRDLFQFSPQVDMLLDYDGNNDDSGTALYIGGRFNQADPGTVYPVGSRNLAIWDAADYFYAGNQSFDAAFGVTYGFQNNPATAATAEAEIYTMFDWEFAANQHGLVVGGDFNLVIPSPAGPVTLTNLALWLQNPTTGRWGWSTALGNANGPVRAVTTYDPPAPTPPGIDLPLQLIIGGDFTTVNGVAANRLAFRAANTNWAQIGAGITSANASVTSLAVWDPPDPGAGDPSGMPPIPDPPDAPSLLFIGGTFTGAGTGTIGGSNALPNNNYTNIAISDINRGIDVARFGTRAATPQGNINGPVLSMQVFTHPQGGALGTAAGDVLYIGGQFTNAFGVAAQNLVAFGFQTNPDFLVAQAVAGGIPGGVVRAMTVWDPPDINGQTLNPVLVIGGQFAVAGQNNIVTLTNQAAFAPIIAGGTGTNGTVRALTTLTDEQEPGVAANLRSGNPQSVLYVGGDFTQVVNSPTNIVQAARVAQFSAFRGQAADFFAWSRLNNGIGNVNPNSVPTASVFALSAFDDGNTLEWDRHDRRATRAAISVSPDSGSFANMRVRVYDSNFNIVYGYGRPGSETIALPFPDPAGMVDLSLSAPNAATNLEGIKLWAGQTYYVEISDYADTTDNGQNSQPRSTGRYNFSLTIDAIPPDLNGDGQLDDINATVIAEPTEGNFNGALQIATQLGSGDGSNFVNANTAPLHGNGRRVQKFNPSLGTQFVTTWDAGLLSKIDDTDLYSFRAEATGYAEIRLTTTALNDSYGQWTVDTAGNATLVGGEATVYNSLLDSVLRVFRNDFEQIGYNDDNPGVAGEPAVTDLRAPGSGQQLGFYRFFGRDPRVIIPVTAGNFYFIQVESGQRYSDGRSSQAADRTSNIAREIEVRQATGSYQLFVNQMPQLDTDTENSVPVQDDHSDQLGPAGNLGAFATPISIGDAFSGVNNGRGSVSGIINNTPLKPSDADLFSFVANGDGTLRVNLVLPQGSALLPIMELADPVSGNIIATAQPVADGLQIQTPAQKGTQYVLRVRGSVGSEGAYTINISGVPETDDHADSGKLWNASDIVIQDFLGQGTATGSIEAAGDTDMFRFRFNDQFTTATITVTATTATLDPTLTVYEVNEDPSGRPVLMRIGFNDNFAGLGTAARVLTPINPDRTTSTGSPPRNYPYYYVLVRGANLNADAGGYTVTISVPSTDDHPDGDTNADGVLDTGEFSLATRIAIDPLTGLGASSGLIERTSDSDLFQFTVAASGQSTVSVARTGGSTLRQRVSILDAQGNLIAQSTAADSLVSSTVATTFAASKDTTYFLVVAPFEDPNNPNVNTTSIGDYSIDISSAPVDDYPNEGEFDLAAAISFSSVTGIGQLGGDTAGAGNPRLSPDVDTDLFTFRPILTGNQIINVTPFVSTSGTLHARLRVFSESSTGVRTQIADVTGAAPGQAVSFTVNAVNTTDRYYVLVSSATGSLAPNTTGEYRVRVTGPVPTGENGGPDPAAIDFNNPTLVALNPRTGDGEIFDTISPAGDRDIFTFTTAAAGTVFIQVVTPSGSLLDASVRVLDRLPTNTNDTSDTNLATVTSAFDADGIVGTTGSVKIPNAPANKQYWIVVDGLGDSTGSYILRINTQPVVNRLVYPEGLTNGNIAEFVSIINPSDDTVSYTIYVQYEWGRVSDQIVSGTVRPRSRDGLTIANRAEFSLPNIQQGVPYSIVLESDKPLGATLAHYDFGNSVGDSFSERVAPDWQFARVERTPGLSDDFLVFYNPQNFEIEVTLTAYQNGQTFTLPARRIEALRRGGFDINNASFADLLPRGVFSVKLSARAVNSSDQAAFEGIVASLSHYTQGDTAFGLLGDADGGATRGIITNIVQTTTANSEVVIFNPGNAKATVSLTGSYVRETLPNFTRSLDIAPRSQLVLNGATLGLITGQSAGLTWRSNLPVVVNSNETQNGDADSTQPTTSVATQYYFGDAYIQPSGAGKQYFETIFLANPTSTAVNVNVRLVFFDQTVVNFTQTVRANGFAEVRLHERPEVLAAATPFFAVDLSAAQPFAANMVHYDLFFGGGWATSGVPFGITNSLARIIS